MAILARFDADLQADLIELTTRSRVFAPHKRGLGYIDVIGFTMEHAANQFPDAALPVHREALLHACALDPAHPPPQWQEPDCF